ncbi:MAG: prepilin peptidase [Burkholderiales bacterium]|nr:prepilin peptidase [Burkholderiales bacterium]
MTPDALFAALLSPVGLGVLGLCIGSFLNVVAHRLPQMLERDWWRETAEHQLGDAAAWARLAGAAARPPAAFAQAAKAIGDTVDKLPALGLAKPRSRCPQCGHQLRWHENLPLIGWLRLKGRCAACGRPISARYPIVEALTGGLFAACAWKFGAAPATLAWCAAVALMVAIALVDLDTTYLPDDLSLPLLGLGIAAAGLGWTGTSLTDAAWGAFAGYGGLWLLAYSYKKLRGVEGMGEGDFKLLAGLGALLGWQLLPSIVLLASAVGAVVGIGLIVFGGHKREVPIPFGPYLVGGGLAAIFFGRPLTEIFFPMP